MEVAATCGSSLNYCCSWTGSEKIISGKPTNGATSFLSVSQKCNNNSNNNYEGSRSLVVFSSKQLRWRGVSTIKPKFVDFEVCSSYKNAQAPAISTDTHTSVDEALDLKKKSQEIHPYLSGRCIYLVGMMGSGKTTVGKILAEVLGYSFFDSDKLVEQAVGATSVAQIFKDYSESFFRDNESEVLGDLSLMRRLVVATGGGAVIRPINWKYMKQGITVWLDVPLEALARRIAAVGTHSRPLLHCESGDAYTKALNRLSTLSKERGEVYANADARVRLQHIASKLNLGDVSDLTPTAIAIEALEQIEKFVKDEDEEAVARNC